MNENSLLEVRNLEKWRHSPIISFSGVVIKLEDVGFLITCIDNGKITVTRNILDEHRAAHENLED